MNKHLENSGPIQRNKIFGGCSLGIRIRIKEPFIDHYNCLMIFSLNNACFDISKYFNRNNKKKHKEVTMIIKGGYRNEINLNHL